MIKISVIIPVFNVDRYLRQCLDSVFVQTLREIEVICIDDGSEDHSYDILLEYQKEHGNMLVFRQTNQGAGPARNYGIRKAAGKYLCFMDPDDYYAQDTVLEKLYMTAENNHVSICGGNILLQSAYGERKEFYGWFSSEQVMEFKDFGFFYNFQRYIFLTELIRRNTVIFPPYRRFQDPPFLLRAMVCAQKFYAVNDVVYIYRTDHKKVNYTLEKAVDLLRGIRDCHEIACNYDLTVTYRKSLQHILIENLGAFYRYAVQNQKAVWELIDRICKIRRNWLGETVEAFRNAESLEAYIVQQKAAKEKMLSACRTASQIVIYGAGVAGRFFLQNYGEFCGNMIGFAVSKRSDQDRFIEGYEVKEISEYSRSALVIVAVSDQYVDEVLHTLEELQFKHVCYAEYEVYSFLEREQLCDAGG